MFRAPRRLVASGEQPDPSAKRSKHFLASSLKITLIFWKSISANYPAVRIKRSTIIRLQTEAETEVRRYGRPYSGYADTGAVESGNADRRERCNIVSASKEVISAESVSASVGECQWLGPHYWQPWLARRSGNEIRSRTINRLKIPENSRKIKPINTVEQMSSFTKKLWIPKLEESSIFEVPGKALSTSVTAMNFPTCQS